MTTNANQILPFGLGTGALVLTPAQYQVLADRLTGFSPGIADPAAANTAFRQSAFVTAALAQFVADYGPSDVLDDANVTRLENLILAAIRAATSTSLPPGVPYEGYDTGGTANAAFIATTSPISTALQVDQVYLLKKNALSNTGATTIKVGTNAVRPAVRPDGSPLQKNDWDASAWALFVVVSYDSGATLNFQLLSQLAFADESFWHKGSPTTGTATALVTTLSPTPVAYLDGLEASVPITTTNGVSPTIDLGDGTLLNLVSNATGLALRGGEMPGGVGYRAHVVKDGLATARLMNPRIVGVPFNIQAYSTSQRTYMTGNSGNSREATAWSPGPYVVKSSTSTVVASLIAPCYAPGASGADTTPASAANINLKVGGQVASTTIYGTSVTQKFTGLGIGSKTIAVTFSNPLKDWVEVMCPTGVDAPFFNSTQTASLVIYEVEL